jgi:hypothetical protein
MIHGIITKIKSKSKSMSETTDHLSQASGYTLPHPPPPRNDINVLNMPPGFHEQSVPVTYIGFLKFNLKFYVFFLEC